MRVANNLTAKTGVLTAIIVAGLGLTACATPNYDDEIAALNSRVSAVEGTAATALQRADAAAAAANAAQAAAANANQRLDVLTTRVDVLEQQGVIRQPRN